LGGLIAVVAPGFELPKEGTPKGQAAESLSDLHKEFAEQCSAKYEQLATEGRTKEDANADPELQLLQEARRKIRAAMIHCYREAETPRFSLPPRID
jgi:hypothetical protein